MPSVASGAAALICVRSFARARRLSTGTAARYSSMLSGRAGRAAPARLVGPVFFTSLLAACRVGMPTSRERNASHDAPSTIVRARAGDPTLRPAGNLDHTEEVAIGIFQNDIVITRCVPPRIASRPDLDQPSHFVLLVVCVQVEMQSAPFARALVRILVEGHIGSPPLWVTQNHPPALRRLFGEVVEGFLPERQHLLELVATDDDRPDLQLAGHLPVILGEST